jgi:hypothetical protein
MLEWTQIHRTLVNARIGSVLVPVMPLQIDCSSEPCSTARVGHHKHHKHHRATTCHSHKRPTAAASILVHEWIRISRKHHFARMDNLLILHTSQRSNEHDTFAAQIHLVRTLADRSHATRHATARTHPLAPTSQIEMLAVSHGCAQRCSSQRAKPTRPLWTRDRECARVRHRHSLHQPTAGWMYLPFAQCTFPLTRTAHSFLT